MKITVNDAICRAVGLLASIANMDQNTVLEVNEDWTFKVVKPVKQIFETGKFLENDTPDIRNDVMIYFNYLNPKDGPITRVGVILENKDNTILLWDFSVDGIREFSHVYMTDVHYLLDNNAPYLSGPLLSL
jgi:hypothetical protein